ncbi:AMP-binding protein [Caldimonas brevitalea]|uniref:Benzoate-CoA ligase n=1 Tax=Caldimonas brevitalea TaxID=413882 RepID=A0A0G3BC59_9BURK|nr:AMP-binding protein [Caldimonas brevitalea]AKJ26897.1 benzoate-CoA ligase [Caldimonas brevitalea]
MHLDPSPGCVDLLVDRHVRAGLAGRVALIEGGASGRRTVRYGELQRLSVAAARELDIRLAGSRRQQRVALVGSATLETVVYWLGAMRAGHLPFLVHPDLPASQYDMLWRDFDPRLVLADRTSRVAAAEPMTPVEQLADGAQPTSPHLPVSDLAASFDLRPALVLATSGSTGRLKLCVHAHRSFWEFERTVTRRMWGITREDRVLASIGPFFSFGLQGLHAPLSVGATAVMVPQWQQHTEFLDAIEAEAVSVFLAVPTLYHLLTVRARRPYRFDALRLAMSAGERLPPVVRQRWEGWSGTRMLDSIGATETFAPYLSETVFGPPGLQPVDGFRYTEMPHAASEDVPSGTFALGLREGCLMLGYLDADVPGSIASPPTLFETGDLFVRDAAGLRFVSRDSERIKVAGHWVSPQELEAFLLTDKRVLKAAAVPITTPEGLTRLRAYLVTAGGCEDTTVAHDLMKRMQQELHPKALRPDRIEFVADIATTPSGKLKRQELVHLMRQAPSSSGVLLAG